MSRPSIRHAVLERLRGLRAIGKSRHEAKQAIAAELGYEKTPWSLSTGRIHSHRTYEVYREWSLRFAKWAHDEKGVRHLDQAEARAEELASAFLAAGREKGWSPSTLRTARSALRMLFEPGIGRERARALARDLDLGTRSRESIRRSRERTEMDRRFEAELRAGRWTELEAFARATGLRRRELASVRRSQVEWQDGRLWVKHIRGKGGRERDVPVLRGHEEAVLQACAGKGADERLFPKVPKEMDVHARRRAYAKSLYRELSGNMPLPPAQGRLPRGSYDRDVVSEVSRALGHNRVDVVLRHYLR